MKFNLEVGDLIYLCLHYPLKEGTKRENQNNKKERANDGDNYFIFFTHNPNLHMFIKDENAGRLEPNALRWGL